MWHAVWLPIQEVKQHQTSRLDQSLIGDLCKSLFGVYRFKVTFPSNSWIHVDVNTALFHLHDWSWVPILQKYTKCIWFGIALFSSLNCRHLDIRASPSSLDFVVNQFLLERIFVVFHLDLEIFLRVTIVPSSNLSIGDCSLVLNVRYRTINNHLYVAVEG